MKKLFLVCLMMLAGSAWAEWVMYGGEETSIFYYDPATVRKDGSMRRVWELQDLRKRRNNGVMSRRMRSEYDCKQEQYRILALTSHTEPMADGMPFGTAGEDNTWRAIAPDTIAETIFNIVCAK